MPEQPELRTFLTVEVKPLLGNWLLRLRGDVEKRHEVQQSQWGCGLFITQEKEKKWIPGSWMGFLRSVLPFAQFLYMLNRILPCIVFSRENTITFCHAVLKEFLACWELELLFPLLHQTAYNPALLCIILFQIWTIWILHFMLARKFGWLYFIIALEKKGELSFYGFSLLKSSEETVIVLITKLPFFFSPLLLAHGISKL